MLAGHSIAAVHRRWQPVRVHQFERAFRAAASWANTVSAEFGLSRYDTAPGIVNAYMPARLLPFECGWAGGQADERAIIEMFMARRQPKQRLV